MRAAFLTLKDNMKFFKWMERNTFKIDVTVASMNMLGGILSLLGGHYVNAGIGFALAAIFFNEARRHQ
jgi:hypothetical protein